jgi:hypothetical protein
MFMKTLLTFFTLLFVLVSSSSAQDKIRLSLQHCPDGTEYLFELDAGKVITLPMWQPESDKPVPVSLKRAVEIGRTTLKGRYPDIDELEVMNVSINEIVSTKRLGRWYYVLSYVGKRDGKSVPSCRFFAVVLMDGSSIEPVALSQKSSTPRVSFRRTMQMHRTPRWRSLFHSDRHRRGVGDLRRSARPRA